MLRKTNPFKSKFIPRYATKLTVPMQGLTQGPKIVFFVTAIAITEIVSSLTE